MKKKAKLFGIYLPVFVMLLIAALALRTVALFLDFDFVTHYYTYKTLISIANYITIAACAFLFTYIFTARRDMRLIPDFTSPATYVPTGIVVTALVFLIKFLFDSLRETKKLIELLAELSSFSPQASAQIPQQRLFFIILLLTAICAILSIVHFSLTALIEKNACTKRASYGIFTVLFLSIYGIYLYFNSELPINAPNKMLDQLFYLLAAVFFLYETRLSLGREKWRAYISFGFIAAFLGLYSSAPAIIIYFAKGEIISNSIYESALTLALSIFITSRILLTGELIEDTDSSTVSALIQFFEARDAEINPKVEAPEVIELSGESLAEAPMGDEDGNQITIEDVAEYTQDELSKIVENEADTVNSQAEKPENNQENSEAEEQK